MNLDHFLTPYTKINSKWIKDLNVRQEAIKILEEKAGKNLLDLGCSNFLFNTSLEATETKAKMNTGTGVGGRVGWVMGIEEGTFWDEHWVLYGNQFDSKFHILKK